MRRPSTGITRTDALRELVASLHVDMDVEACRLLFLHPEDLAWGPARAGLYMVTRDHETGEEEEEEESFTRLIERAKARAMLDGARFAQTFLPFLNQMVGQAVERVRASSGEVTPDAVTREMGALGREANSGGDPGLAAEFVDGLDPGVDYVAAELAEAALRVRRRQIAALGWPSTHYEEFSRLLARLGVLETVACVEFDSDGNSTSVSLGALRDLRCKGNSRVVVWKFAREVRQLKRRGEDQLMQRFIAEYINSRMITGPDYAFACARFGESDEPEFDVLVPILKLGIEVKLMKSPAARGQDDLRQAAGEFEREIRKYAAVGAEEFIYVTSLDESLADSLLADVRRRLDRASDAADALALLNETRVLHASALHLRFWLDDIVDRARVAAMRQDAHNITSISEARGEQDGQADGTEAGSSSPGAGGSEAE